MIPYFKIPSLELFGPLELQPFGVLVAIGILMGSWFAQRRAAQEKIDVMEVRNAIAWAVVCGFIGAHLVAIIFYFPERIREEGPLVFLKIWSGISSYGGFLGAIVGLVVYFGVQKKSWLHLAEIEAQALVIGWIFGRLACTVAYDHPGQPTDWFLGHEYKDGIVRHNLGLYEFLYTLLVITPVMLLVYKRKPRRGTLIAVVCLIYAPVRFLFDYLRAAGSDFDSFYRLVRHLESGGVVFGKYFHSWVDAVHQLAAGGVVRGFSRGFGADLRYLGLTPAQYFSLALVGIGVVLLWRSRKLPAIGTPIPGAESSTTKPQRPKAKAGSGKAQKRPNAQRPQKKKKRKTR